MFVHIFKAAGTSVQAQLRRKYGTASVPRINDGPNFPQRLAETLQESSARVLSGHFQYRRIAQALEETGYTTPVCFSFVRNPVARIVSAYKYFRATPARKWHQEACDMDINAFVVFLMQADPVSLINHQCRVLSAQADANFETARDTIENHFAFVGCMEQLEHRNAAARNVLGMQFDARNRHNASPKRQEPDTLQPKTLSLLQEITQEDEKLYSYISEGGGNPHCRPSKKSG